MEIILITILLTTLGLCLVALLVWLSIMSIRLMRFSKKAEASIKHIERWIEDNQNTIMKIIEEIYDKIEHQTNDLHNRIDQVNKDVNDRIDTEINELNSKIDSRCDKLYDDFSHRTSSNNSDIVKLELEIKKMNEKVEYSNNRWLSHKD